MRASPAFLYCRHAVLFLQGAVGWVGGAGTCPGARVCVCFNSEGNWRRNRYFRATARFSYRFGTELGSNTDPPTGPHTRSTSCQGSDFTQVALIPLRWGTQSRVPGIYAA